MGDKVEDAEVTKRRGGSWLRKVDKPYGGTSTISDASPPPGPGTVDFKFRRHHGDLGIDDTWSGTASESEFADLVSAATTGQTAFNSQAAGLMGAWYTFKPSDWKSACRDAVLDM